MVMETVFNYIDGRMAPALSGAVFAKRSPATGEVLWQVARSTVEDVEAAVAAAQSAHNSWARTNVVKRADLLREIALRMRDRENEIAELVAAETGKSPADALGETQAAIEMGFFIAGEGRRYYGKTTTASMDYRSVMTMRQPLGVAALIIASNTPIANVAWKAFPAILCGNASILKPSEDTPATAWIFADICRETGLPDGVFNVVQGYGREAGSPLVESSAVDLVSFTGSCETGRWIQERAGKRLAKVCLEMGGKNPMVICDDADIDNAVQWALASSFSNAGQRCAAASRIIVFDSVYEQFCSAFVEAAGKLSAGPTDKDYLGPVINESSLRRMLDAIRQAVKEGACVLTGGDRLTDSAHEQGWYMAPTIIEEVSPSLKISRTELFGPVTILYRVQDFTEALAMANDSDYGLTAAVHTDSMHRAMEFAAGIEAGVVVVNGGTHGSEPHMGFGGVKNSGTGWREAGVEVLDVYSDWKYVNLIHNPARM